MVPAYQVVKVGALCFMRKFAIRSIRCSDFGVDKKELEEKRARSLVYRSSGLK